MEYKMLTRCLYGKSGRDVRDSYGAVSYPIYQTATFAHEKFGTSSGYDYSRMQNPTREQLEKTVAALENGVDALAFSSGMSAISALMELFHPGDNIISSNDLYGGTVRLFESISRKNGIEIRYSDCSPESAEALADERTKAIYFETPTNPMMNVISIREMSNIAKRHGILLIVDNTFLSPYFQNPIDFGADIVVHSGTKFLAGHNDTMAGFLVTDSAEISGQLRYIFKTVGSALAPFDSWLVLRGIKTLGVRMEQGQKNAMIIAKWLSEQKRVTKVLYPGLAGSKGGKISREQSRGSGCMLTFETDTVELALKILNGVQLIRFAESLGGVETLITYPITQTHSDVPKDRLKEIGITERVLRLSVGIEDAEDLIHEFERLFNDETV